MCRMDPASETLPDDVAAPRAALVAEGARRLEVAGGLAVARAKTSEDMALIAAQKLSIAKLERQVFGQRSERSARLIDQLALEFEELQASGTDDELAAEQASARMSRWIRRDPAGDAYDGYTKLYLADRKPGRIREEACWVHPRHPFRHGRH